MSEGSETLNELMHVCQLPRQSIPRVACEQASLGRRGEGEGGGKGREGKERKEERNKLYGSQLSTCSALLYEVKIPTNQLLCLYSSWSSKFCLSLFKMASCANETMAGEIFVVEVTRSFTVFIIVRMMVRMLSQYLSSF